MYIYRKITSTFLSGVFINITFNSSVHVCRGDNFFLLLSGNNYIHRKKVLVILWHVFISD